MTRDEMLRAFDESRSAFDTLLRAVPAERFAAAPPGFSHSPKEVVAHVVAYEGLIVERLSAAREAGTTAFDRDRAGWEAFNDRVWAEAAQAEPADVLRRWEEIGVSLRAELAMLTDDDLDGASPLAAHLDPAWLDGHTPAELIAVDAVDHYPMHHALLEAAAG